MSLVTVTSFEEPWTAHIFCGRLEIEGILSFIDYQFHIGNNWPLSTALGWVKVRVPVERLADAKAVMQRAAAGEFRSELENAVGELDDPQCPVCGSAEYWKRRPHLQVLLAVLCTFLVGLLSPWSWVCFCNHCGAKFRP